MRRVVVAAALAGLTAGALGQNISTGLIVSLTFDKSSLGIGETATATITASWNGVAGSYLSSFNIDLMLSNPGLVVSNLAPIAWNNPALGFTGTPASIEGGNIIGLQAAQFSLIPPFVNINPILVTTFTVTLVSTGSVLEYSARVAAGAPFPFSVTGPVFNDPVVQFGLDSFRSDRFMIPSPSAVGLLGMAGVLAGRRRR